MTDKDKPRLIVTLLVFALFAFVLWHNRDNEMLIGAMIGALTTAVAFWLGSSKGSSDKASTLAQLSSGPTGNPGDPVHVEEDAP